MIDRPALGVLRNLLAPGEPRRMAGGIGRRSMSVLTCANPLPTRRPTPASESGPVDRPGRRRHPRSRPRRRHARPAGPRHRLPRHGVGAAGPAPHRLPRRRPRPARPRRHAAAGRTRPGLERVRRRRARGRRCVGAWRRSWRSVTPRAARRCCWPSSAAPGRSARSTATSRWSCPAEGFPPGGPAGENPLADRRAAASASGSTRSTTPTTTSRASRRSRPSIPRRSAPTSTTASPSQPDGTVRLKCRPEIEAQIYEMAGAPRRLRATSARCSAR